ncbi:MAG: VWA domain-containing protein, partial [Chloroflexia bacterium]
MSMRYRYSQWDDTQQLDDLTADELLDALSDELIGDGDLLSALQRLYRWGDDGMLDNRIEGLQDLLERLRQQRRQELASHDLGGVLDEIKERLRDIIETERQGIEDRLAREAGAQPNAQDDDGDLPHTQGEQQPDGGQPGDQQPGERQAGAQQSPGQQQPSEVDPALRKLLEQVAGRKQQFLNELPDDPAGQLRELSEYEFMNPQAAAKFAELQSMLQQQALQQQFQGMEQAIQQMRPEDMEGMREMVR